MDTVVATPCPKCGAIGWLFPCTECNYRRSRTEDCTYCAAHKPGEMMPPHDASSRCESGKRNHCTCDTCF